MSVSRLDSLYNMPYTLIVYKISLKLQVRNLILHMILMVHTRKLQMEELLIHPLGQYIPCSLAICEGLPKRVITLTCTRMFWAEKCNKCL